MMRNTCINTSFGGVAKFYVNDAFSDPVAPNARQRPFMTQKIVWSSRLGLDLSRGLHRAAVLADAEVFQTKMRRRLRTPDEALRLPGDKAYVFTDSVPYPICADRKPYYEQAFMAGRFHPKPYVPGQPLDKVRVKTRRGYSWRKVIAEPVPPTFANYPQYAAGGEYSRIARWQKWLRTDKALGAVTPPATVDNHRV